MSLERNFLMASLALAAVRQSGIRANNLRSANDMPAHEWHNLTRCIDGVRAQSNTLDRMADLARQNRCGNCTEQDAVAIQYLRRFSVRPLDLMNLYPYSGVDHTFVVIGRLANSIDHPDASLPQCRPNGSVDSDPTTWGPDAVVCDPWHDSGKVYAATELQTKMFRGYHNFSGFLQPASIWRLN